MDINRLVNITSRAWCLSILAALEGGVAARQAVLVSETGAGRTAFTQSLAHLVKLGLIQRNPGHGHPLRPEYCLSEEGHLWGRRAVAIMALMADQSDRKRIRKSWVLPVLVASGQAATFSDISQKLPKITDRALSLTLKELEVAGWVDRGIDAASRPPRPLYSLTNEGERIVTAVRSS